MSKQTADYTMSREGIFSGNKQLTNYRVKILSEKEVYRDSMLVDRKLELEARKGDEKFGPFEIDANDFERPDWVTQHVGVAGIISWCGPKELAIAIRHLSGEGVKRVRRYRSLGFTLIDGRPAYVHGDGVLAGSGSTLGNVESGASETFPGYGFPDGSTDPKVRADYLKAPLELLRLSKKNPAIGVVLLGSAVRAVLSKFHPCTVTPILIGETGAGKSELLAMATSFFRPGTELATLPFNMASTARGLRLVAQASSHTLLPIDDYYPTKGKSSDDDDFIEMLIHGGSSTAGRKTAQSSSELHHGQSIRTLAMITAEVALVTDKASRHARALYCELGKNDVDAEIRLVSLRHAKDGNFARAMREFVVACLDLDRHDKLTKSVSKTFECYRAKAAKRLPSLHRRYRMNAADIMLGVHYYLKFCLAENVIEEDEYERLIRRNWNAIVWLMKEQDPLVQRYSADQSVSRALGQLLQNGKYHLLQCKTKECPEGVPAERVGWVNGQAQGEFLGYVDATEKQVYVPTNIDIPRLYDALPLEAQRVLSNKPKQFWKQIKDLGLLTGTEDGRNSRKIPGLSPNRGYWLSIPGLFR